MKKIIMQKFILAITAIFAFNANAEQATDEQKKSAAANFVDCAFKNAPIYDDLRTDPKIVSYVVAGACQTEYDAMVRSNMSNLTDKEASDVFEALQTEQAKINFTLQVVMKYRAAVANQQPTKKK